MAVITSSGSGLFSATGSWVGGVVPVLGDSVIIALTHVITVDGTYHVGDDTVTAFDVRGTLRASRVVNNSLTVRGQLFTAAATTATIDYGRRSTSDRIPAAITATLILNSSAAMANFKYGLFVADLSNAYFAGALKTINARITTDIPAGGTTCIVDDATGWAVGDNLVMAPSSGVHTHHDSRTILTIVPGAGTTATITFAAVTFLHGTNCPIGNRTSNVTVKSFNTTNSTFTCFRHASTASDNRREVDNTVFEFVSSNSALTNTQIFISSGTTVITRPFVTFCKNFYFNCSQSPSLFISLWNSNGFDLEELGFFSPTTVSQEYFTASGTFCGLARSTFYFSVGAPIVSAFSQGGQGPLYTDVTFCSGNSTPVTWTNGDGAVFTRCAFHTATSSYTSLGAGSGNFINCNFGKLVGTAPAPSLWGTPTTPFINSSNVNTSKGEWNFIDCNFIVPSVSFNTFSVSRPNPQWILRVINKDTAVTAQEEYSPSRIVIRDSSVFSNSTSSFRISPSIANTPATRAFNVFAPTGVARTVTGYLRYNPTYGVATPPSVTLAGLGITPQTFTAGGSADTWYPFSLTATQVSGGDGNLILTVSGQSTSITGLYYLSGIPDGLFVTSTRHYGFYFDSLIYNTVDPIIDVTAEATVAAYTNFTINHGTSTITITGNATVRQLYDFCKYDLTQNLTQSDFFTSTDAVNFASTYSIVINTGVTLSGVGQITISGGRTLTMTGTAQSALDIAHTNGTRVWTRINVSGLIANSRLRIFNTTGSVELVNAVVAGTSYELQREWAGNIGLDFRVTYVVGLLAYTSFGASGSFTETGVALTVSQELDVQYNAAAIDGSTLTGITPDYPNQRLVFASGTTYTVQQIYARYRFLVHTVDGIVQFYGGAIMQDAVNMLINSATLPLVFENASGDNITITNGYIARADGASWMYANPVPAFSFIPVYDRAYIANSTAIKNNTDLIPALL